MKTKVNISIQYANDLISHIADERKLTKQQIIDRALDIRDNLVAVLEYLRLQEERTIQSKTIKQALSERLNAKRIDESQLELNWLKSARMIRELNKRNEEQELELEELKAFKEIYLKEQGNKF
jgi:predicted DNA-binding protein YlxM (UPF0122 family)